MIPELATLISHCQRWENRGHSWLPVHEGGFDRRRYRVLPIDTKPAKAFVIQHHYSGAFSSAKQRYGLFEGEHMVGVLVLGVAQHKQVICKPFPTLDFNQGAELSRLVLLDAVPPNAESYFVAGAFRLAAREGLRAVVSFSDPVPRWVGRQVVMPGHVGTVYQAMNAVYTGRSKARPVWLLPDGTVFGERTISKIRDREVGWRYAVNRLVGYGAPPPDDGADLTVWLPDAFAAAGAVKVRPGGKHRYCWPVGTRDVRRRTPVALDPLPFPKDIDPAIVAGDLALVA